MCGIVGYVGARPVCDVLLKTMAPLEYRGYDSAGIAMGDECDITVIRASGKLSNLCNQIQSTDVSARSFKSGIGHVRWATHGAPTCRNAHPHTSQCGRVAIVHNGIIENYQELKSELIMRGCVFASDTDSEVIAHLVAEQYDATHDLRIAVTNVIHRLAGVFAICVMHSDCPGEIVVTRRGAPLLIGVGDGDNFIASDVSALLEYTRRVVYLDDMQVGRVTASDINIFDSTGARINYKTEDVPFEPIAISKCGHPHFMIKEIFEQPSVVRNSVLSGTDGVTISDDVLRNLSHIEIVACGTSLHAAMVGKYFIQKLCTIPVTTDAASEYIYQGTIADSRTLFIAVSQSGETADTLAAVRVAKSNGAHILVITSRPDSAMARIADSLIITQAGIEVSVAATKSFTAQLMSLYLLGMRIAAARNPKSDELAQVESDIQRLPALIEECLNIAPKIKQCAEQYAHLPSFTYIARGINVPIALEGALKLKEIAYINAAGYAAGELKHGPIAMLDNQMPVIAILTNGPLYDKMFSNTQEASARGARIIAVTSSSDERLDNFCEVVLRIPDTCDLLSPIVTAVPLQLIAYYVAASLGCDVDQPRNLAKSVTVE